MRVLNAPKESGEIAALLDQVNSEPVLIRRNDRDPAVVVSPAKYERLRRIAVADEFRQLAEQIGREAKANGLTPEILDEMLAEAKAERTV